MYSLLGEIYLYDQLYDNYPSVWLKLSRDVGKLKVAVQWTGGKTSSLACYKTIQEGHQVACIITFLTEKTPSIHALDLIKLQSEALGMPFLWDKLEPPYPQAYRDSILNLKKDHGIDAIVTGDTSYADGCRWIDDACKEFGIKVLKPLWGKNRRQIFQELLSGGFKVVFASVTEPRFDKEWLGKPLNKRSLQELETLGGDIGEYHTMTLDAPLFKQVIEISEYTKEKIDETYVLEPISVYLKNRRGESLYN
jgi:diphthine-ammonia ligase